MAGVGGTGLSPSHATAGKAWKRGGIVGRQRRGRGEEAWEGNGGGVGEALHVVLPFLPWLELAEPVSFTSSSLPSSFTPPSDSTPPSIWYSKRPASGALITMFLVHALGIIRSNRVPGRNEVGLDVAAAAENFPAELGRALRICLTQLGGDMRREEAPPVTHTY